MLCYYLAQGMSLRRACEQNNMPATITVFRWLSASNTAPWADDFRVQYARAKEEAADAMAEDILDIADDGTNDYIEREGKDGSTYTVVNNEVIQRSRLRVDTRKWLMAKMKPKRYGDKLDLTSGGEKISRTTPPEEIEAILARADAQAGRTDKPVIEALAGTQTDAPTAPPQYLEEQFTGDSLAGESEYYRTPESPYNPLANSESE
jgi:hypothetical protein